MTGRWTVAEPRRDSRLDQPREPGRLALPRLDPESFGRWSEAIARFMGTARFLVYMTVVIIGWIAWNSLAPRPLRFDPYTFTFLTLILSLQASYAAPLILLAQNRQADRDRLAMEEDRRRAAMQKADTEYLAREIASLRIAMGEVATRDFIRSELTRLMEELDEAEQPRPRAERRGRQPSGRAAGTLAGGEPADEVDSDRSAPAGPAATRPGRGGNPGGATKLPRAPRGGARGSSS
jgi:uncharacterized membrane protein